MAKVGNSECCDKFHHCCDKTQGKQQNKCRNNWSPIAITIEHKVEKVCRDKEHANGSRTLSQQCNWFATKQNAA